MTTEHNAIIERIERLERKVSALEKQARRYLEYPKKEFYPHFPEIVLGNGAISLLVEDGVLIVKQKAAVVGSVALETG